MNWRLCKISLFIDGCSRVEQELHGFYISTAHSLMKRGLQLTWWGHLRAGGQQYPDNISASNGCGERQGSLSRMANGAQVRAKLRY